jgi:hypothetical protein
LGVGDAKQAEIGFHRRAPLYDQRELVLPGNRVRFGHISLAAADTEQIPQSSDPVRRLRSQGPKVVAQVVLLQSIIVVPSQVHAQQGNSPVDVLPGPLMDEAMIVMEGKRSDAVPLHQPVQSINAIFAAADGDKAVVFGTACPSDPPVMRQKVDKSTFSLVDNLMIV